MYESHNSGLLRRLPLSAHVILEVGGGDGELAATYRRLNPKAKLLCFVAQHRSALLHEDAYDQIEIGDVEAAPLPFHDVIGRVDCIIYDGCLEQMRDPLALLRRHADAL